MLKYTCIGTLRSVIRRLSGKSYRLYLAMLKPDFDAAISTSDSMMGSLPDPTYSVRGDRLEATEDTYSNVSSDDERLRPRLPGAQIQMIARFDDRVKTGPGCGQRVSVGLRRF